ncbi:hypothetical protein BaOVIS_005750 [Babesia ovis]|uniref:Uncharacterized protein n=1 Tax=Babesia ovis TaxID=5869 RepID=A0A9W5WTT3_BABOV|nr:hypothetical protein BaOVIS_005750 [Babesia ovis]
MTNAMRESTDKDSVSNEAPGDNPYVVDESLVLLDFPEFQATSLFDEAVFRPQSEDDKGITFAVDNSNIKTLRIEGIDTETPSCLLQGQVPLQGKRVSSGVTYFCFDISDDKGTSGSQETNVDKSNTQYWYTSDCIEFTTKY